MWNVIGLFLAAWVVGLSPFGPALAEETTPLVDADKRVLTPEEKAQKEARKACKAEICNIFATADPTGNDVSCAIVKTWREEDITKLLGGKVDWPYGKAVCRSQLELERAPLARAMSEPSQDVKVKKQTVRCTLDRKGQGEPYVIEINLSPAVHFEKGKAVKASINWGETKAPPFLYPLLYAGTGLDNQSNFLGPEVVKMVNEFTTRKCAQHRAEAPNRD